MKTRPAVGWYIEPLTMVAELSTATRRPPWSPWGRNRFGQCPHEVDDNRTIEAGSMRTLAEVLAKETREGELSERLPDGRLRCLACGHLCPLPDGAVGVCKVRFNDRGHLRVPWGYVGGVQCDPIEKKPFFHAYPGSLAYSFGMLGCDLHCGYCQNWVTSSGAARSGGGLAAAWDIAGTSRP